MKFNAALVAAMLSLAVQANVGVPWSISKAPPNGLDDITFAINMANAQKDSGYYFAMQFSLVDGKSVYYTGLQPRPNNSGGSVIHAVFSSFQTGTTTNNTNCYDGADGGDGVSCAIEFKGDYSHTYKLNVKKAGPGKWRGQVIDSVTGSRHEIGSWTLPSTALIKSDYTGFVEYYPWNLPGAKNCPKQPFTDVTFYNPTSTTTGASGGAIDSPYDYGDCKGEEDFAAKPVSSGYNIKYGKIGKRASFRFRG